VSWADPLSDNCGNPLDRFHNPNVFSTIDNFSYKESSSGPILYLTEAVADYYVIGWHSNGRDDPFFVPDEFQNKLSDRIEKFLLKLGDDQHSKDVADLKLASRAVCYGAIYGVTYDQNKKPDCVADRYADMFDPNSKTFKFEPVSVGSTAIDGIITFVEAHKADAESVLQTGDADLVQELIDIRELLYASDDSYGARSKAQDMILQNNFAMTDGGQIWRYASDPIKAPPQPGDPPAVPSTKPGSDGTSEVDNLRTLNNIQATLDVANRKLKAIRWNLWAEWWKFISDDFNSTPARCKNYSDQLVNLTGIANKLATLHTNLMSGLESYAKKVSSKNVSADPFFQKKDPTVCIAGIDGGWPSDYTGKFNPPL
jgi:hypothetical protein